MTEHDWLTSADPHGMLSALTAKYVDVEREVHVEPTARKLRLFACACCRTVFDLLTDERSRRAVEVAERFADGQATEQELIDADYDADHIPIWDIDGAVVASLWIAHRHLAGSPIESIIAHTCDAATQAALLRDIFGNPWRPVNLDYTCPMCRGGVMASTCAMCGGNSLRHPWLSWHEGLIPQLAEAAYQERGRTCERCGGRGKVTYPEEAIFTGGNPYVVPCRDCGGTGRINDGTLNPERLAVLADALEEAGAPEEMSRHLRETVPCEPPEGTSVVHVRGCWALDLLTGRS